MVYNANAYLVTSFFKSKITKPNTHIFPPFLKPEIIKAKPKKKNYILVYFTSEYKQIIDILKTVDKKFIVYGFNKNKKEENIIFKKTSQKGFLADLTGCEGIIANAGFTLMTEALYLKKPYLALPVKGQFEQILNAYFSEPVRKVLYVVV